MGEKLSRGQIITCSLKKTVEYWLRWDKWKQNVALDTEGAYKGGLENPVCQGWGGEGTAVQCLGQNKS